MPLTRRGFYPLSLLGLLSSGAAARGAARQERPAGGPAAPGDLARIVQTLTDRVAQLEVARERELERVAWLSVASPPVGTILAHGGDWPPWKVTGKTRWSEDGLGWMLCDGRALAGARYEELRTALGREVAPDARGYFLRGVGGGANVNPDAATREFPGNSGRKGDLVGTIQGDATGRPKIAFTTDDPGDHQHIGPTNDGHGGILEVPRESSGMDWLSGAPTSPAGRHTHHVIGGGDHETRPINLAVHWIIKFRSTPWS